MVDGKRRILYFTFVLIAVFVVGALPLHGQDSDAEKKAEPEELTVPVCPGEELVEAAEPVDAGKLLAKVREVLGGENAFLKLEDLTFGYKHKHYNPGGSLVFLETAKGYIRPGKSLKARTDFDYPMPRDRKLLLDYREIIGDDGPFIFREGKILTFSPEYPLVIENSTARLFLNNLILLAPFCLDLETATLEYAGEACWECYTGDKTQQVKSHKFLVDIKEKGARFKGNVLALYVDKETNSLRRMAFLTGVENTDLTEIVYVDVLMREKVGGLMLPAKVKKTVVREGKLVSKHLVYYSNLEVNTGLTGIGFEIADQ